MTGVGISLIVRKPEDEESGAGRTLGVHAGRFLGIFVMTISNPMTALGFVGIFAGIGVTVARHGAEPAVLVGGVFLGSMLWWAILSALAALGHGRLGQGARLWINRGSGGIILALGLLAAGKAAFWLAG